MKWNPDGMGCLFLMLAACVIMALGIIAKGETKKPEPPAPVPAPTCDCRCRCEVDCPEPLQQRPE